MLFLASRAGAERWQPPFQPSPHLSPPVNLVEMTNRGGGFGLAPSRRAERELRSPCGTTARHGTAGCDARAGRTGGEGLGVTGVPPGGRACAGELHAWFRTNRPQMARHPAPPAPAPMGGGRAQGAGHCAGAGRGCWLQGTGRRGARLARRPWPRAVHGQPGAAAARLGFLRKQSVGGQEAHTIHY